MSQLRDTPCQQHTIAGKNDSAKTCTTLIFLCTVAFAFILLSVVEAGSLLLFDFRYAATDDNYIYNKEPTTSPSIKCIGSASFFDSNYQLDDDNHGIRSVMGLYLNRGVTSPLKVYSYVYSSSYLNLFNNHDTNSYSIRFYANPLLILPNPVDWRLADFILSTACIFGIGIQYSGTSGVKFVYGSKDFDTLQSHFYYSSSLPLITSPTWIDATVSYQFLRGAPSNIKMSEIVYSSAYKSGSLPQMTTDYNNINDDLVALVSNIASEIVNSHFIDITIQYVSIYGGETTADYLSKVLCPNPTLVPPEYCSNPSNAFLSSGCTDTVGSPCKAPCDINYCPSASTPPSNYSSPLSSYQIVALAIIVSVAVDAVLIAIYYLLILCAVIEDSFRITKTINTFKYFIC